jgi:hypothetical protein
MLELRPTCEQCIKALPPASLEARLNGLMRFLPFADSAKGRCPRSGRRGHEHHNGMLMTPPSA